MNTEELRFDGGTDWGNGASIAMLGQQHPSKAGYLILHSNDTNNTTEVVLTPNGDLIWNSNGTTKNLAMQEDFIPRSGGVVLGAREYRRTVNNDWLNIHSSSDGNGSYIGIDSGGSPTPGTFWIHAIASKNGNASTLYGSYTGTLSWDGQPIQYPSDQRLKQQINQIDDKLLDAWEDVTLVQFKYNDAVEEKGNQARLHTGYVVQQIDTACKSHNIDISKYGLYCHEEYQERTEEVEVQQDDGTTTKETKVIEPAKEHYSLRYTETLVVECAYLRRENSRLKERLSKIEKLLNI